MAKTRIRGLINILIPTRELPSRSRNLRNDGLGYKIGAKSLDAQDFQVPTFWGSPCLWPRLQQPPWFKVFAV